MNQALAATYIATLVVIGLGSVAFGIFYAKKHTLPLRTLWLGFFTYIIAEVLRIGAQTGLKYAFAQEWLEQPARDNVTTFAVVVGAWVAALAQEPVRHRALTDYIPPEERTISSGILQGLGHGGMQLLFFALLAGGLVKLAFDGYGLSSEELVSQLGIAPSDSNAIAIKIDVWWNQPWWSPLLELLQQFCMLVLHVGLSAWMMSRIIHGKHWVATIVAAIVLHAIAEAPVVYVAESALDQSTNIGLHLVPLAIGAALLWVGRRAKAAPVRATGEEE